MHERVADRGGGLEQERRECVNRERWMFFLCFPEIMRCQRI